MMRHEDDITNGMLLQHMQGMKTDLQQQISHLDEKIDHVAEKLTEKMDQGFEDARRHRQALQEDLEETMRVQSRHGAKLARI